MRSSDQILDGNLPVNENLGRISRDKVAAHVDWVGYVSSRELVGSTPILLPAPCRWSIPQETDLPRALRQSGRMSYSSLCLNVNRRHCHPK